MKPSLTLNYGLHWDVLPPWYEKYNQLLSLDPNEQSVVFPSAPKGILFPGDLVRLYERRASFHSGESTGLL